MDNSWWQTNLRKNPNKTRQRTRTNSSIEKIEGLEDQDKENPQRFN